MPRIAISYRRADSLDITGRIFDRLALHYGKGSVFRDIDNIRPGIDFRDQIADALAKTDAILVVLGPRWLGRSKGTQARIDDEADPVRIELEIALDRKIPVIPVLVSNARMPQPAQLPERIREFAFRHAVTINSGWDFDHHVDGLIRALDEILPAGAVPPGVAATPSQNTDQTTMPAPNGGRRRRTIALAAAGGLAVMVAAAVVVFGGRMFSNKAVTPLDVPATNAAQSGAPSDSQAKQIPPQPAKQQTTPTPPLNPAIAVSPPGTKKINPIAGMPFTLGDNYAAFKAFYPTAPEPKGDLARGDSSMVSLSEISAEFFFTKDQTLYRMWFGPRFKGNVLGIEIGDPFATIVQKLGQPQRYRGSNQDKPTNIAYDFPDKVSIAFQLDSFSNQKTNGFWLFDDSIQPMNAFSKYTPPPPPPSPEAQERAAQERAKAASDRLKGLERTAKVSPPLQVTFGDTYELVKTIYKTTQAAVPYKKGTALRLSDVGLWFFFDEASQIRTIRFDAPFAGTVAGVKIGDTREKVIQLLGKPQDDNDKTIYFYSGNATFWFDDSGHVVSIFL
jgi:hypothetical protein